MYVTVLGDTIRSILWAKSIGRKPMEKSILAKADDMKGREQ